MSSSSGELQVDMRKSQNFKIFICAVESMGLRNKQLIAVKTSEFLRRRSLLNNDSVEFAIMHGIRDD